jgi:hypothetical protein
MKMKQLLGLAACIGIVGCGTGGTSSAEGTTPSAEGTTSWNDPSWLLGRWSYAGSIHGGFDGTVSYVFDDKDGFTYELTDTSSAAKISARGSYALRDPIQTTLASLTLTTEELQVTSPDGSPVLVVECLNGGTFPSTAGGPGMCDAWCFELEGYHSTWCKTFVDTEVVRRGNEVSIYMIASSGSILLKHQ